jgi:CRP/FNR family transcriptional regulator, cyclic AMP receptor protein
MLRPRAAAFDPQTFLEKPGDGKNVLAFPRGHNFFLQGEALDTVFYLQKGRVKLLAVSPEGKEAVVGILGRGQFFGEACLSGLASSVGVAAIEDCVVTVIPRKTMIDALGSEPQLSVLFVKFLLDRHRRIEEDLIDQLFNSSEKRLARILLLLANVENEASSRPAGFKMSQETLAEMVGTTRSRISFFMNKFRKMGFVDYDGEIRVHPSLLDAVLRDKPRSENRI